MSELTTFEIQPAPGLLVRDPLSAKPLAAEGEAKPRNKFWLRRLADGDVHESQAVGAVAAKQGSAKTNNNEGQ